MATTTSWFDKDTKQRKEETEWHSVVVWGPRGEALNKILSKGSRILVLGKLKTRSREDAKGGGKRYATEIVADNVILCGGRGEGQSQGAAGGGDSFEQVGGFSAEGSPGDDDIPF